MQELLGGASRRDGTRGVARDTVAVFLSLLVLSLLFWWLRILRTGVDPTLTLTNVDLYNSHVPMMTFGFDALRAGHLPLWNPYQLFGEPFFAAHYAGLLYPLNAVYLLFSVPVAMEISLIAHMFGGALGMWALCRRLALGHLPALCAALGFVWSGWVVFSVNQPRIFAAECWMPVTLLLIDRVVAVERRAWLWLVLGVAVQLLIGAMEILTHTLLVGGLFTALRLVGLARSSGWSIAVARGGIVLACLAAATLLCAAQLIPTLELVRLSGRSGLEVAQALQFGVISWAELATQVAGNSGWATAGALPLVAVALAAGAREHRWLWLFAAIVALVAADLAVGGVLYRLYFALPLGDLFRRPFKFLDVFCFAQALLAGLAVASLQGWVQEERARLWTNPAWLAALALGVGVAAALTRTGLANPYLLALLASLILFGALPPSAWRRVALAGVIAVHGFSLVSGSSNPFQRPVSRPEIFASHDTLFEQIDALPDQARVYISPHLWFVPGLTLKQGMLRRIAVSNDYEPLALRSYGEFFTFRSPWRSPDGVFNGRIRLLPESRWRLMDLGGTRYFIMRRDEPGAAFMTAHPPLSDGSGFRLVADGDVQVFEKLDALPRGYFVPTARTLDDPAAVLAILDDPRFDPRAQVVLEGVGGTTTGRARGSVTITRYEPERVEMTVDAEGPGYLVLSDLYYPGWKATVGGEERAIHRANYLFRAVAVEAGHSRVRFDFRPASLRAGLAASAAAALGLALLALSEARRGAAQKARKAEV